MEKKARLLIEFGSNTTKVMSVSSETGEEESFYRLPLRLASRFDGNGNLGNEGLRAMLDAIGDARIRHANAKDIILIGTEALRRAANQADIKASIHSLYGLDLRVLSAAEEAEAAYQGVKSLIPKGRRGVCFDIGGSSTEIVKVHGTKIESMDSFALGAVDLAREFAHGMPISNCGYTGMRLKIESTLRWKVPTSCNLIGSGGSVHTCAMVAMHKAGKTDANLETFRITKGELIRQVQSFRAMDLQEIARIPGMDPARADIIMPAVMIMLYILEQTEQSYFIPTNRGVRHGIIANHKK